MKTITYALLFAVATLAYPQAQQNRPAADGVHKPRVVHAEVPLYPTVALAAHFGGTVAIEITVRDGAVSHAAVKSVVIRLQGGKAVADDSKLVAYLSIPSLDNVKTWKFVPEERTTFVVTYTYRIEGTETPMPENPTVTLDLPTSVTVVVRPYRPTNDKQKGSSL